MTMRGHELLTVTWVASAAGSGFVAACECGWETSPSATRAETLGKADHHLLLDLTRIDHTGRFAQRFRRDRAASSGR
jgi:hypothetical protein